MARLAPVLALIQGWSMLAVEVALLLSWVWVPPPATATWRHVHDVDLVGSFVDPVTTPKVNGAAPFSLMRKLP